MHISRFVQNVKRIYYIIININDDSLGILGHYILFVYGFFPVPIFIQNLILLHINKNVFDKFLLLLLFFKI